MTSLSEIQTPTVGAVLLAAGAGSRMGGRPKALLELGGVPLIRRQLLALSDAGVAEVAVVLGHHAELIAPLVQCFRVTLVHNPCPDDGQVSSLRLGLQALNGTNDAVLVALADQPLIDAGDIRALIGAYETRPEGAAVLVPQVDGERGNPVVFSREVRRQILAGDAQYGCRQWQDAHPEAVARLVSDNRRYRLDVDTLDDIERFERDTGLALRWPTLLERCAGVLPPQTRESGA